MNGSLNYLAILVLCYCLHFGYAYNRSDFPVSEIESEFKSMMSNLTEEFINNSTCHRDLWAVKEALFQGKSWAAQYFDSYGSLPSGLLLADTIWPGSFSECRKIKAKYNHSGESYTFHGKSCKLNFDIPINSPKSFLSVSEVVTLSIGICLPESCSLKNIEDLLHIQHGVKTQLERSYCTPNDIDWSWRGILGICICAVFGAVIVVATLIDILYRRRKLRNREIPYENVGSVIGGLNGVTDIHPDEHPDEKYHQSHEVVIIREPEGIIQKLAKTFSAVTNGMKIFDTTRPSDGTLDCIHGIRFLSMSWVILGHTYFFAEKIFSNKAQIANFVNWEFQVELTAGTYSVDSFFLLSGTLVAYLFLCQVERVNGVKNIPWIKFYVHRFWRLTPAYMLIMGVYICIFPYLATGPFWPIKGIEKDYCATTWWKNLLYINNVFKINETCMGWSWYLANDMQFYVISPLFLIPMALFPVVGIIIVCVMLLGSWIATGFVLTVDHVLPADTTGSITDMIKPAFMTDYYTKPYTRIGPYLVGAILGYILYRTKCKVKMNKILVFIGWCLAIALNLSLVYGEYHAHPSKLTVTVLYTLGRSAWAVGLAWVILCCCTGYGGPVNILLSWKPLIPLSRLTYCAYLIHPVLMYYFYFSRESTLEPTHIAIVPYFFGFLMMAYGIAFVCSLAFEAPMIALEKLILQKKNKT